MAPVIVEDQLQAKCFQWHWNTFVQDRQMLFHVQQKAKNATEGARFKAIGVVPGISDMVYVGYNFVAFIEFKTPDGQQRPDQKTFEVKVTSRGHKYYIVRTFEHFKTLILTLQNGST